MYNYRAMPTPPLRGRFLWHELMTSDTKSAADFYTKVAGWKTEAWNKNPSYTMFTAHGRFKAGLMALPEPDSPLMWLPYIGTPNLDDTVRQAGRRGGKVLKKPADIPTVGRFAIIQDPQGATFAAFTPLPTENPAAADAAPAVGEFSWHELLTTDWPGALAFYLRLGIDRVDGYGLRDGDISDVRLERPDPWRHVQQTEAESRAAGLAFLYKGDRREKGGSDDQRAWWSDHQRADGGPRRRLDYGRSGSAGRRICRSFRQAG
jgi:predicted enzyme related to lactoylglutathione lyase